LPLEKYLKSIDSKENKMSETNTYTIKGMHCASCAIIIEKTLNKAEGVESARVNFGTELVRVVFNKEKTDFQKISKKVEPLGYSLINMSEHASHMNMNQPRQECCGHDLGCFYQIQRSHGYA